jgi:hypothetical protein
MSDAKPTDTAALAKRVLWCAKGPDGELRLSLLGSTMWLAWGRVQEVSGGGTLDELQSEGWRVVRVSVEELPA